jgi:hypothetical protein
MTRRLTQERPQVSEFSLLGGPLHRLGSRLGLVRGKSNPFPLGLALGWSAWAILIGLAFIDGIQAEILSLSFIAAHVRFLIAVPLLFLCESSFNPRLGEFVGTITRSGVVPSRMLPALETEIARIHRWTHTGWPDAACALAAVVLSLFAVDLDMSGTTTTPGPFRSMPDIPIAAFWYWIVCLPLFRFLIFRWVWKIALWWFFLARLARLDLHLVPTHPDGVAGLGYLETTQTHLAALVLAISVVVSASFAEDMASGATGLAAINPVLALALFFEAALIFAPLCFFAPKLRACQEKGLRDYTEFASRYVGGFEQKWLKSANPPNQSLIGSADIQSLADLANSFAVVRAMRWVPASLRLLIVVVTAALLPMLPLLLFEYPVTELIAKLFSKLAGL